MFHDVGRRTGSNVGIAATAALASDEEEGRLLRELGALHGRLSSLADVETTPCSSVAHARAPSLLPPAEPAPRCIVASTMFRIAATATEPGAASWALAPLRGTAFFAATNAISRLCGAGRCGLVALAQGIPEAQQASVRAAFSSPESSASTADGALLIPRVTPAFVSTALADLVIEFVDSSLWPVLHTAAPRVPTLKRSAAVFDAYAALNAAFADAVAALSPQQADVIIVHDVALLLLPRLLRSRLPSGVTIVLALEAAPFPSFELFRCIPARRELLEGLLGADLVVLGDAAYARNVCDSATQLLGLDATPSSGVAFADRTVALHVMPLACDSTEWSLVPDTASEKQHERMRTLRRSMREALSLGSTPSSPPGGDDEPRANVILALDDGVDATRGIFLKLLAYEDLLSAQPELRGNTLLIYLLTESASSTEVGGAAGMVGGGSCAADGDAATAGLSGAFGSGGTGANTGLGHRSGGGSALVVKLHEAVGRINGRFASPTWTPLRLLRAPLPHEQLVALFSICDAALLTNLRDSLPVGVAELAAAQVQHGDEEDNARGPAVAIISEFSGSAHGLSSGAMIVNPVDTRQVAAALRAALTMTKENRVLRSCCVLSWTAHNEAPRWAERVLRVAAAVRARASDTMRLDAHLVSTSWASVGLALSTPLLQQAESGSARRLVLIAGLDSVQLRTSSSLEFGAPSARLRASLAHLCADPRNSVWLSTEGKPADLVDAWLGDLPIGLSCEGGFVLRFPPPPAIQAAVAEELLAGSLAADIVVEDAEDALDVRVPRQLERHERLLRRAAERKSAHWSPPPPEAWRRQLESDSPMLAWRNDVRKIISHFQQRTPGASLTGGLESSFILSWADADADFGPLQARDLLVHLSNLLEGSTARVALSRSRAEVVVSLRSCTGGSLLAALLASSVYGEGTKPASGEDSAPTPFFDFLLTVGDDDGAHSIAHSSLPSRAFSVAVGKAPSGAKFFVESPEEALALLDGLSSK